MDQQTPQAFQQMIVSKYPGGVSSTGTPYAQMDPNALIQSVVAKYPDGVTSSGVPYKNYLPQQSAPNIIGGVGNFLFPIVQDVANDVTGKSTKSFLQQAGDTALSALPFIPGLGEGGEAARAVGAGAEVAEEAPNVVSKIAEAWKDANPMVKSAAVGYGAGTASSLSRGKSLGQAFSPNVNNILGAILGGVTPKILEGLTSLRSTAAGISPQIATGLTDPGITEQDYNAYMDAAKNHSTDVRATPPLTLAADKLDDAANRITTARGVAGAAVGAAKKAAGQQSLNDITPVFENFVDQVADKFGISLVSGNDGTITPIQIPGRSIQVPDSVMSRIMDTAHQLNSLADASVQQGSDVATNISNKVDYSNMAYGKTNDPLESILKNADGGIRGVINQTSPELAAANANFSALKELEKEVGNMAGDNLQRGELLMKRVFSGEKSGDVQDLFEKIKEITGIDLINHAVLAKHAIETLGSGTEKSLLEHAIEGGTESIQKSPWSALATVGQKVLRNTLANPESMGRNIVNGGSSLIPSLINKGAIEVGARGF
jgi:hypothetical protein